MRTFRLLRQHGMSVNDRKRHTPPRSCSRSTPSSASTTGITDIQAAVGREQLHRLPEIVATRRRIAARYARRCSSRCPACEPMDEPAWARSNWQSFLVRLADECDQRTVMQRMLDRGVATRRGIMCAHREVPYQRPGGYDLPSSEEAQDRFIVLPLYPQMTDDEIEYVCGSLREATSTAVADARSS